ncbi:MAG: substrate-binding domain-containing protein [Paludibacter sp.]|nr:substrate-binding domain-containing protein [Paludibacter sp.]
MKQNDKIRIKDIAVMAGVSEGTVDRVLHNRGEVSQKSREAVEKVLHEIDYSPNILARSLASKKQYRFVSLIPFYNTGDYWQSVDIGFEHAAREFSHYNVNIERKYFNQYDQQTFVRVSAEVLAELPDAVFIPPIFRQETIRFTNELYNRNILFSFIDSLIENSPFVTYYGQNSSQSGYVGAKLLSDNLSTQSKILVIRTQRKGEGFSNQTMSRCEGFEKYLKEKRINCQLVKVELTDGNEETNNLILNNALNSHPDVKAAITFNSKVFRLAKFLTAINRHDVLLLGYDLLQENIEYMKKGVISYLIAQRPEKQAYFTVRDMCNELIFHKEIQKINYMPIDILMKENIEYYMNFRD